MAVLVPEHWTVSVSVMVPLGGALAVQLTPAVNVTGPSATGLGVESSLTTLVTWAGAGGAKIARMSNRINVATALPRIPQMRKFLSAVTTKPRCPAFGVNCCGDS